ncbi:MAG: alpha/beta hydrolase [Fulvivirga sp.]|nr:alpha/beta hydrolase [Fulvivirga sp.]
MRVLKSVLFVILPVYLLIIMVAFLSQEKMIFFPDQLSKDYAFNLGEKDEEVFLTTEDGETINGLFYEGHKTQVILYFHGNAGSLEGWQHIASDFTSLGYHFLIIDYRGYGKSTGDITEKGLYRDAQAAFNYLTQEKGFKPGDIIIYGRSIGTGVATELATQQKVKGLVLESAFTSLKKLANQKMPFLLPSLILEFHFNNIEKLQRVSCPIAFIHGSEDTLIPPSHTEKLFEAFSGNKEKVMIEGAGHNDLNTYNEYHQALADVLSMKFN